MPVPPAWLPIAVCCAANSCGSGLAGIVSATSGGSSSRNAPPEIADESLTLSHEKASPARVSFVLIDAEGDRVSARLQVRPAGTTREEDFVPLLLVPGPGGEPTTLDALETASAGLTHVRAWDFATQLGPEAPGAFEVRLELLGQSGAPLAAAHRGVFVGNDLPMLSVDSIELDPGSGEASGNVDIELTLTDPTPGSARCRAEFRVSAEEPWCVATPAGTPAMEAPPEYFIEDLSLTGTSTTRFFVWDSVADQIDSGQVQLRFRVDEEVAAGEFLIGEPVETAPFAVDNNANAVAILDNELLGLSSDERRVLPIPFQLQDAEEDPIEVVLQWRRPERAFPRLPQDRASIEAILADPEQRELFQVCTEAPREARGVLSPLPPGLLDSERRLRLVELAGREAAFLSHGVGASEIELLRPPGFAEPPGFQHELDRPVALVPIGNGTQALALDRSDPGWRLARVALADGEPVGPALLGPGTPTALALAPDESAVFVAANSAQGWSITRVTLEPLEIAGTSMGPSIDPAGVRGLLALDGENVLLTADDALLRLAVGSGSAPIALRRGLDVPWGLARRPHDRERILLSERGADRVAEFDLLRHSLRFLPATTMLPGAPLPAPRALAIEGGDLLVVTEPVPGAGRIRRLPLGTTVGSDDQPTATPLVTELGGVDCDPGAGLSAHRNSPSLLADPRRTRPLLAGGILHTVELGTPQVPGLFYHPATQTIELREALDPAPAPGTPWRIRATAAGYGSGSDTPRAGTFPWDTRDVVAGDVYLRLTPLDGDVGVSSEGLAAKPVRLGFLDPPVTVGDALIGAAGIAVGDLDGDGDLDIGTANEGADDNGFTLFEQLPDRGWESYGGDLPYGLFPMGPTSIELLDLDADGRLDVFGAIPSTKGDSGDYHTYLQRAPEAFVGIPLCPSGGICARQPMDLLAADLDGDGDLDLAAPERKSDRLRVLQVTPPAAPGGDPTYDLAAVSGPNRLLGVESIAVADLDRDGDLDLVGGSFDGNTVDLVYQGPAGFWSPGGFTIDPVMGLLAPRDVLAVDVNADGRVDLVVATDIGSDLTLLTGTAQGFLPPRALGPDSSRPGNLVAIDCDVDGDLDLAYTVGDSVHFLPQIGPDRFALDPIRLRIAGAVSLSGLASADLDGDADHDLLVTDGDARRLSLFYQGGRTRDADMFTAGPLLVEGGAAVDAERDLALGDLDGDADLDLVSVDAGGGKLDLWSQRSPGRFERSAGGALDGLDRPRSTEVVDIDGDADLDLITASSGDGRIVVHAQVRPGAFELQEVFGDPVTNDGLHVLTPADLDGDGRVDVVTANKSASTLTLFLQDPTGSFGPVAQTLPLGAPSTLVAVDLDRDGDLDLVAGRSDAPEVALFTNRGPLGFEADPLGPLRPSAIPTSITAADLDADGQVDVLSVGSGSWATFSRDASGAFGRMPLYERDADLFPRNALAAGDLDSDGRLDVAIVSLASLFPSFRVYTAVAPGLFDSARWTFGELGIQGDQATTMRLRDLDGDQDLDVILGTSKGIRPLYRGH